MNKYKYKKIKSAIRNFFTYWVEVEGFDRKSIQAAIDKAHTQKPWWKLFRQVNLKFGTYLVNKPINFEGPPR